MNLYTDNTDGSDSEYMPSDMAPLGLDEVNTWVLVLGYVFALLLAIGIPSLVAFFTLH